MPASTEPNFGIKHSWAVGESYKPEMDANLKKLGALFFCSVKNATTTAQPGSPAEGDRYIVGAGATGAWAGKDNQIAVFANTAWLFYVAAKGWLVRDESVAIGTAGCFKTFDGTDWVNADFGNSAASQPLDADLTALAGLSTTGVLKRTGAGTAVAAAIVNADIDAAAAIALSKLATITANRAVVSGTGGVIEAATATRDQVNALAGRTATRVGFFDGSGLFTDSANLVFDNTNVRFGVGGVPAGTIHAQKSSTPDLRLTETGSSYVARWGVNNGSGGVFFSSGGHASNHITFWPGDSQPTALFHQNKGTLFAGNVAGLAPAAQIDVRANASGVIGVLIRAAAAQTSNLREEQDSATNILSGRNAKGKELLDGTLTAGGTTGAQTINKPAGSVNFAAAATSLVVTCDQATTTSIIQAFVQTNDATMKSAVAVPASGSFTIYPDAAPTSETKVSFIITEVV